LLSGRGSESLACDQFSMLFTTFLCGYQVYWRPSARIGFYWSGIRFGIRLNGACTSRIQANGVFEVIVNVAGRMKKASCDPRYICRFGILTRVISQYNCDARLSSTLNRIVAIVDVMNPPKQIYPLIRIPPPLLFLVAFLAGAGLQRLAGLTVPAARILQIAGFALIGCAIVLALCSLGLFLAARTTVVPFSTASKLVTWGPYRFTRNPMYLSLILAYLGAVGIFSQVLALFFLALPIILVHKIVIPFEEKRMRGAFGEPYDQYCSKVRRWL